VTTWGDLYGLEPSSDPAAIEQWAAEGHDLAIVLNELPLDGPLHPAVVVLYPDRFETICEATGHAIVTLLLVGGDRETAMAETAEVVADWGCTFMILRGAA
jgi:hypothetical protein